MREKHTDNTATRTGAVVQGLLLEVSPLAQNTGIPYPVFITKAVNETCIAKSDVPEQKRGQRLQDLMVTLRFLLASAEPGQTRVKMMFAPQDSCNSELFHLEVVCAALEKDSSVPALTIILPGEA